MDPILVISSDPALAETLASELGERTVSQAHPTQAALRLEKEKFCLVLLDEDAGKIAAPATKVPVIKLSRPIRLRDLLYTIKSQLQSKSAVREAVSLGTNWRFFPGERLLRSDDAAGIALTEKEAGLLTCLLETPESPVKRETLLKRVWGYSDDIATRTIETHIHRLRGKLKQATENIDIIFLNDGGYQLKLGGLYT